MYDLDTIIRMNKEAREKHEINPPMVCSKCSKKVRTIHVDRDHKRVCEECYYG